MNPFDAIISRAARWPGVQAVPDGRGGTVLLVAGRELASVARGVVDVPLSAPLRDQVLTDGMADRHRLFPHSEWVSYRVRSQADVAGALRLLRVAYWWDVLSSGWETGDSPAAFGPSVPGEFGPVVDPFRELDRLELSPDLRSLVFEVFASTTSSVVGPPLDSPSTVDPVSSAAEHTSLSPAPLTQKFYPTSS